MEFDLSGLVRLQEDLLSILPEAQAEVYDPGHGPEPNYNRTGDNDMPVHGRAVPIHQNFHQTALPPARAPGPSIEPPPILKMISGVAPRMELEGGNETGYGRTLKGRNDLLALNPWRDGALPANFGSNLANRNANALEAEQHLGGGFGARVVGMSVSDTKGGGSGPGGMNALGQILVWLSRIYDSLTRIESKLGNIGGGAGSGSTDSAPKNPKMPKAVDDGGMPWWSVAAGAGALAMGAYATVGADASGFLGNMGFDAIRSGKAGLNRVAQRKYERYLKYSRLPHDVDEDGAFNKLFSFKSENIGDTFGSMLDGTRMAGNRTKIWGGRGAIGLFGVASAIDVGSHAWRAHNEFAQGDTSSGWADTREAGFNGAEFLTGMLVKNPMYGTLGVSVLEATKGALRVAQDYRDHHSDRVGSDLLGTGEELGKIALVGGIANLLHKMRTGAPGRAGGGLLKNLLRRPGAVAAAESAGVEEASIAESLGGLEGVASKIPGFGPELAAVWGAVQVGTDLYHGNNKAAVQHAGGAAGGIAGAMAGAALGSMLIPIPGVGTLVGGIAGAAVGSGVGSKVTDFVGDHWKDIEHGGADVLGKVGRLLTGQGGGSGAQTRQNINISINNPVFRNVADKEDVVKMIQEAMKHSMQLLQNTEQHANGLIPYLTSLIQPIL